MTLIATISSEVMLKSTKVRRRFQRCLMQNMRHALDEHHIQYSLTLDWGKIHISTKDNAAIEVLTRIFGISSIATVDVECESHFDTICQKGTLFYQKKVPHHTFAIKTKREGEHSFNSDNVNHQLGSLLVDCGGKVNLSRPQLFIQIKVGPNVTYMCSNKIKCAGGLPLNSEGKALCLISGGFDSAAAAWLAQKRGLQVDYLFCNLAGKSYEQSVLDVIEKIVKDWSYGYQPKVHIVDFEKLLPTLKENINPSYSQVVLKRLFYKTAEKIAKLIHADAIITGEALAQVSSQTLSNLKAIEANTTLPILRPLITFDKEEIIDLCRKIGTYTYSEKIKESCQISKSKPVTTCSIDELNEQENKVPPELLENIIKTNKFFKIKQRPKNNRLLSKLSVQEIKKDALLLDCRTKSEYEKKHLPNAKYLPAHMFSNNDYFDKQKTYIIYCDQGIQSALLAESLQQKGFKAFYLKGHLINNLQKKA